QRRQHLRRGSAVRVEPVADPRARPRVRRRQCKRVGPDHLVPIDQALVMRGFAPVALSLVLGALLTVGGAAADAKRPVTLDDLDGVLSGQTAMAASIGLSADGRSLAVERGGELWVVDAQSGRILHRLGEGLIPRWSRDGSKLAFLSH